MISRQRGLAGLALMLLAGCNTGGDLPTAPPIPADYKPAPPPPPQVVPLKNGAGGRKSKLPTAAPPKSASSNNAS